MTLFFKAAAWLATVSVLHAGSALAAASPEDWITESDVHGRYVMEELASLSPENASASGLAEFDAEVSYLGPDYREREDALEARLIGELHTRLQDATHPRVRQDLQIMIDSLNDSRASRKLETETLLPYLNMHEELFGSFRAILDPRIESERRAAGLTRLARYAGTEQGYVSIVAQAEQRTREALAQPGLIGPYRGELESDLADAPRYVAGIRSLFEASELTGWEDDLAVLSDQLNHYEQWLRDELLPRARDNNLLPPRIYADALKNFGVRATPEELIADATAAYQSLRSEMHALAIRIAQERDWKENDLVSVLRRLKKQQIPPEEVLATYKARLTALETIIRDQNLVSLPRRDASIRLATEAEAASIPASFMSPPQLINNTGQYGEFVLVQSNPGLGEDALMDDWSHEAITWALTAHEARPGHELQFARLVEDGVSIARVTFAFNSANAEGWGLYAEALVHPYLSTEAQLFSLYSRLMRATRMFLDPMVNTGQLSRDEAAHFLETQLALSPAMAASEADRYTYRMPGQATAYYYGYMKLMGLRTEVELHMAENFNLRTFNDFILEQGILPPQMLREAVLEHFAEQASTRY